MLQQVFGGKVIRLIRLVDKTLSMGKKSVKDIKGHLKVSASKDGFFQEAHIKLGPLDFPSDGISLCGCAKSPKTLKETCEEGIGAAMRASIPMRRGYIEAEDRYEIRLRREGATKVLELNWSQWVGPSQDRI